MKKTLTILVAAILFFNTLSLNNSFTAKAFSDVAEGSKYSQAIKILEEKEIVKGDSFRPYEFITKEEFARWMLQYKGVNADKYTKKTKKNFSDVKRIKNPNYGYIYKLVDLGVLNIESKSTKFNPQGKLTRLNAIKWIFELEGIATPKVLNEEEFLAKDVKPNSDIGPIVDKAIKLGMLEPGNIKPMEYLRRNEAAHYLKVAKSNASTITVTIVPSTDSDMIRNGKYDVMVRTWNKIFDSYYKKDSVNKDDLVYSAIEGMVKGLGDKYSDFERPGNNSVIDSLSGEVEGIGAVLQKKEEAIVVVAPIVNSPAEKAGLLPNDEITAVNDKDIKGMTLSQVVALIKGKKGTSVKLTVKRGAKTLSMEIIRDIVKIPTLNTERTDDNILIITLNDFGANCVAEMEKVIEDVKTNKPKAIIFDLRNNPGGYLTAAVDIGGFFIPRGQRVASVKYPNHEEVFNSTGNAELGSIKTAVLVNGGSASASEIVAGALQDYGVIKVIGEKTFGKGTVQEVSSMQDGSVLKLTVAEWLTPKGRSIQKNGIMPDIEVKLTEEDRAAKKDPQLDRALSELRI